MDFLADLHIHSRFSIATSKQMDLPHIHRWARLKGLSLVATGDCTHPQWFQEIREQLTPDDSGLLVLRPEYELSGKEEVPPSCQRPVWFVPSTEISTIYKKDGRVRKIHHLILFPDIESAGKFSAILDTMGNIRSDGRPILGLDSYDLLEIALNSSEQVLFIPAHIWTPHFSVLGARSGFDSVEACYGDLTRHIPAVETGLSSDPPMNRRVSMLDRFRLVSNSDAHSPAKLGRNATRFNTEPTFEGIARALWTGEGFLGTLDMYPEEGKYHYDGHRACGRRMSPKETIRFGYRCPDCNAPVTVGVMHRVETLADRPEGTYPESAAPYRHIIPLPEIISEVYGVGVQTKKVQELFSLLLEQVGPEFHILLDAPLEELGRVGPPLLQEAVLRMRTGRVHVIPGYDGEFGKIQLFDAGDRQRDPAQLSLF